VTHALADQTALLSNSLIHVEIWKYLHNLVRSGRALCPMEWASMLETFKQSDKATRSQTAEVMDDLSGGIALQSASGRRAAEFRYLCDFLAGQQSVPPITVVWTTPFFAFGELAYDSRSRDAAELAAICKSMIDVFSRMRFPDCPVPRKCPNSMI
jgi:hypothetical protein